MFFSLMTVMHTLTYEKEIFEVLCKRLKKKSLLSMRQSLYVCKNVLICLSNTSGKVAV
jgi:hypothetical protein